jgi:hypothetical protein
MKKYLLFMLLLLMVPSVLGFAGDGRLGYVGGVSSATYFVNVVNFSNWAPLSVSNLNAQTLSWSVDDELLAIGKGSTSTNVFNTSSWDIVVDLPSGSGSKVSFSPDGKFLATKGSSGQDNRIYNVNDWSVNATVSVSVTGDVKYTTFSNSGDVFAYGGLLAGVRVINTTTWGVINTFYGSPPWGGMAFSLNDEYFAFGNSVGVVTIVNTSSWSVVETVSFSSNAVNGLDFSSDGRFMAFNSGNSTYVVNVGSWDLNTSFDHGFSASPLDFSEGGHYLALGVGESVLVYRTRDWSVFNSIDANTLVYDVKWDHSYIGIPGCMDEWAINYDATADFDDGSCLYGVYTCADLQNIHNEVINDNDSKNYLQMNDIDCSLHGEFTSIGRMWASTHRNFLGNYDGQGFTISNIIISQPTRQNVGIFTGLHSSNIKNLHIKNTSVSGLDFVGILAGVNSNTTIENVSIESSNLYCRNECGSIAGRIYYHSNYSNIKIEDTHINGGHSLGGILGRVFAGYSYPINVSIKNSYVKNLLFSGSNNIGGVFGSYEVQSTSSLIMSNIYVNGVIGGSLFLGHGARCIFQNSFYNNDINNNYGVGGICSGTVTALTNEEIKNISSFTNWDIADLSTHTNEVWKINDTYSYPMLSFEEYDSSLGCTNPLAANYDEYATEDDGGCVVFACSDEWAVNYEPTVTYDDGSCEYNSFVSEWTVDEGVTISLGMTLAESNFRVDWGDGSPVEYNVSSHTYTGITGNVNITIDGRVSKYSGCSGNRLRNIHSWGNTSLANGVWHFGVFGGCSNFQLTMDSAPDLSETTSLAGLFINGAFTGDIGHWNITNIVDFHYTYSQQANIVADLSNWEFNTTHPINMRRSFYTLNARSADFGDLSNWDTGMFTDMDTMFYRRNFHGNTLNTDWSKWDISNTTNMRWMVRSGITNEQYNKMLIEWSKLNMTNNNVIMQIMEYNNQKYNQTAYYARKEIIDTYNWEIRDAGYDGVIGCMDSEALNYNPLADFQPYSESCQYEYFNVSTCEDFQAVRPSLNEFYYIDEYYVYQLTNDIDCTNTKFWGGNPDLSIGFQPINNFRGTLEGNGFNILNLYYNKLNCGGFPSTNRGFDYGVFVNLYGDIRNLGFINTDITICGRLGGVVHTNHGSGLIENVFVNGKLNITSNDVGGIVNLNYGVINNSYSGLDIFANGGNIGGIVGRNFGVVSNSYSSGYIPLVGTYGGVVGLFSGGQILNSFWDINTTNTTLGDAPTQTTLIGLETEQMYNITNYLNAGWDVADINSYINEFWIMSDGYSYPVFAYQNVAFGCTDPLANNYDAGAELNDGSCIYQVEPVVSLSFDVASPVVFGDGVVVSCSSNSQGAVSLFRNGSDVTSELGVEVFLDAGSYVYECVVGETVDFFEGAVTESFVVNKVVPVLSLSNAGGSVVYKDEEVNVVGVGCPSGVVCYLYLDDSAVSNPFADVLNLGEYVFIYSTLGNHNYEPSTALYGLSVVWPPTSYQGRQVIETSEPRMAEVVEDEEQKMIPVIGLPVPSVEQGLLLVVFIITGYLIVTNFGASSTSTKNVKKKRWRF